ncbi:hypothetical protein, partial [Bacteroides congonensis]
MKFEDYNWHDLEIKGITIDRNNPGKNDVIEFTIKLRNGSISKLLFQDVYWANLSLNFGIVASETINRVYIASEDDLDLLNFKNQWKSILKNNIEDYKMYVFE